MTDMTQPSSSGDDIPSMRGYLFSPSSLYPEPAAYLVDGAGNVMHSWSHAADQPKLEDEPPNYLRGWNHVEVDARGNLFAVVPLRSILKLTPKSELAWSADIAAHHDIALDGKGNILVLAEAPRRVANRRGCFHVLLDNFVAEIDAHGAVRRQYSLYDILRTDPGLRRLIDQSVEQRADAFNCHGRRMPGEEATLHFADGTHWGSGFASSPDELRSEIRRLRGLPGSPCDVLHTNTLEIVNKHPAGIWEQGDVLVCMRELNTIAVLDLVHGKVRWSWGTGELSGPHQPSILPDGTVLVFDNGVDQGRTRLLLVDPDTRKIVWSWSAVPPGSFFCPLAGGCEMLPNGNILVTNSSAGEAFELTTEGVVVWDLKLSPDVYGAGRGRVSIYRLSAVEVALAATTYLPVDGTAPTKANIVPFAGVPNVGAGGRT